MKRMKKLFAILMTMAMVMGLGITGFAAEKSATITIDNAGENAKFNYVQIVVANPETETGWDIVDEYLTQFQDENAFGVLVSEQDILKAMIYKATDGDEGQAIDNFDEKYAYALNAIRGKIPAPEEGIGYGPEFTVDSAGVYVIAGYEEGYTYGTMSAYIGFDGYTTGLPTDLKDATVEAKRVPTSVEKSSDNEDKVTQIGRIETYTVTGTVPYIEPTELDTAKYWITDVISGAKYVLEGNVLKVSVSTSGGFSKTYDVTPYPVGENEGFDIELTEILANNVYANDTITISYQAKVIDTYVENTVSVGEGKNDSEFGEKTEKLYTGDVTLTKFAEDETTVLSGAGFEVRKVVAGSDSETLKFTKISDGVYEFDENGKETEVFTGENGTVTLKGLDIGRYEFAEKTAPEGYSINAETRVAVIQLADGVEKATKQEDILNGTTFIKDTKLSSLPSTGGMGTTLFTIAGCVIMISAAALFFATRKKAN